MATLFKTKYEITVFTPEQPVDLPLGTHVQFAEALNKATDNGELLFIVNKVSESSTTEIEDIKTCFSSFPGIEPDFFFWVPEEEEQAHIVLPLTIEKKSTIISERKLIESELHQFINLASDFKAEMKEVIAGLGISEKIFEYNPIEWKEHIKLSVINEISKKFPDKFKQHGYGIDDKTAIFYWDVRRK